MTQFIFTDTSSLMKVPFSPRRKKVPICVINPLIYYIIWKVFRFLWDSQNWVVSIIVSGKLKPTPQWFFFCNSWFHKDDYIYWSTICTQKKFKQVFYQGSLQKMSTKPSKNARFVDIYWKKYSLENFKIFKIFHSEIFMVRYPIHFFKHYIVLFVLHNS